MKPQKIFEIKGSDWMKGLSIQNDIALGGLFRNANNFDPFDTMGYFKATPTPLTIDNTTISEPVSHLTSFGDGGEGYVFGLGYGSGIKTKTLFRIKISDNTVTDYSDKIDQNGASQFTHNGIAVYKGRLVYEQGGSLRSNLLTPTVAEDRSILVSALTGSSLRPEILREGADGKLYFTNSNGLGVINVVATTNDASNVNNAFVITDTNMLSKDICSDGVYTIFIADDNTYKVTTATSKCRIFFWDSANDKVNADIIYDIPDSYLIACRYVDGKVIVLGASGIWVCNSATPPKLVYPLSTSELPISASAVTTKENTIFWGQSGLGSKIFAYGAKVGKPILYTPYYSSGGVELNIALVSSGTSFISATDGDVYELNSGTDLSNTTISPTTTVLPQPYSLSYVKVVLKSPLTTNQGLQLSVSNGAGQPISDTDTKLFSTVGAKQTLIFTPKASSSTAGLKQFEDFYINLTSYLNTGTGTTPTIQRVAVYGIPIEDNGQQI